MLSRYRINRDGTLNEDVFDQFSDDLENSQSSVSTELVQKEIEEEKEKNKFDFSKYNHYACFCLCRTYQYRSRTKNFSKSDIACAKKLIERFLFPFLDNIRTFEGDYIIGWTNERFYAPSEKCFVPLEDIDVIMKKDNDYTKDEYDVHLILCFNVAENMGLKNIFYTLTKLYKFWSTLNCISMFF